MLVQFIILGYFNLTDLPFCCKKDAIIVFDYDFIGSFRVNSSIDYKLDITFTISQPSAFIRNCFCLGLRKSL